MNVLFYKECNNYPFIFDGLSFFLFCRIYICIKRPFIAMYNDKGSNIEKTRNVRILSPFFHKMGILFFSCFCRYKKRPTHKNYTIFPINCSARLIASSISSAAVVCCPQAIQRNANVFASKALGLFGVMVIT